MKTLALDFDGTIHPYTRGWQGSEPDDEPPIVGAAEFLVWADAAGYTIVIFSSRADSPAGRGGILRWLGRYDLLRYVDDVTDRKGACVAMVDDRAVPFRGDWEAVKAEVGRLADGTVHACAPASVDWRAMFVRYLRVVANAEGVDFLYGSEWSADEWRQIEAARAEAYAGRAV